MLNRVKKLLKREPTQERDPRELISFAQEGEDLILQRIFEGKKEGCFVDVGAHDPKRFSNTYLLYQRGWRGVNIDPLPGTKEKFDLERPEDINLEFGISIVEQELTYYLFNEPALNTFDEKEAKLKDGIHDGMFFITEKKTITTYPLRQILDQHIEAGKQIDLITIDVEGLDLQVLQSNDWGKYQPTYVLVEELATSLEQIIAISEVYQFMKSKGYELKHRTLNTSFYYKKIK